MRERRDVSPKRKVKVCELEPFKGVRFTDEHVDMLWQGMLQSHRARCTIVLACKDGVFLVATKGSLELGMVPYVAEPYLKTVSSQRTSLIRYGYVFIALVAVVVTLPKQAYAQITSQSQVTVSGLFGPSEIHPGKIESCSLCAQLTVLQRAQAISSSRLVGPAVIHLSRLTIEQLRDLENVISANSVPRVLESINSSRGRSFEEILARQAAKDYSMEQLASFAARQQEALDAIRSYRREREYELEEEQRRRERKLQEVQRKRLAEESRRQREAETRAREARRQLADKLFAKLEGVPGRIAYVARVGNSMRMLYNDSSLEWPLRSRLPEFTARLGAAKTLLIDAAIEHDLEYVLRNIPALSDVRRVESDGRITRLARIRNTAGEYRHVLDAELDWLKAVTEFSAVADGKPILFTKDTPRAIGLNESVVLAHPPTQGLLEQIRPLSTLLADCNPHERRQIWDVARTWSSLDSARLQQVVRVIKAPILLATDTDGVLKLRLDGGHDVVEYRDLREGLPTEWNQVVKNGVCIIDVSRLGNDELKADLCQLLREIDNVHWLMATRADSRRRLAMMYGSNISFELVTDDSIAEVANDGKMCLSALRQVEQRTSNRTGARVRVLAGHEGEGTQTVARWIGEAKRPDSPFAGVHLVVVACLISPKQMYEFVNVAIENGALSVSVPYETVSLHSLTSRPSEYILSSHEMMKLRCNFGNDVMKTLFRLPKSVRTPRILSMHCGSNLVKRPRCSRRRRAHLTRTS